ncbi:hypothetical protein DRH27_00295 [Candidatus Falkowbacteria bacterium]|nr:MAG: hypothetical protein DRH27_00295 [Candidatus Falkowbacteria bacterium]
MSLNKKTKKFKKIDTGITIILLIGIFIVINFFSYQIFYRWDLTQNKIYSISKVSKRTVGELDDIVNIKAYFSDNLPSQVLSIKQEVADILDEYAAFSNGKIRVEFIDPNDDEDTQRELYMIGIPQLTFEVYEKDKRQLVNGYMGIAISFEDKTEAIPAIKSDTRDLEYQLTTAIKKVITDEIATIGFLTSQGTASLENDISTAKSKLQELYTVREVVLSEEQSSIPPDIDTLIIVGPKEEFSEDELREINAFLVRGGALLGLIDGVDIGEGLTASINKSGINKLFSQYGLTMNRDLVADNRSGMASFTQGFMTFSTNYPYWPKITSDGFNKDNSAVANLENVILPWVSSIDVDSSKIAEEGYVKLAHTTDKGWSVANNFNISPNGSMSPGANQKQYVLAAYFSGMLEDAYPEEEAEEQYPFFGRLALVGDSDFIYEGFIGNTPDNLTFFLNLVDILSFDEDLISIRSKSASSRPIKEGLSDSARAGYRYFNVFGVTIIVMLFGMIRYYMRRRSRFVDEL